MAWIGYEHYDDTERYKVDAPEFTLRRTGLLNHEGKRIYRKPVIGFHRSLEEYVVVIDDYHLEDESKEKKE